MSNPANNTTFTTGVVVTSGWLNSINDFFYDLFQASTTPAEARDALGLTDGTADIDVVNLTVAGDTILGDSVTGGDTTVNLLSNGDEFTIITQAGDTFVVDDNGSLTVTVEPGQTFLITGGGDVNFDGVAIDMSTATSVDYLNNSIEFEDLSTALQNLITAASSGGEGAYSVTGLVTTNTTSVLTADSDQIIFADPDTNEITVLASPAQRTCNIGTAGPIVGGRDQAGAFSDGTDVHFYYILNTTTDAYGITASASAPPTGPTLPAGYDQWAYIHPIYKTGGNLRLVLGFGNVITHINSGLVVSAGTGSSPTSVSLAAWVPANAISTFIYCNMQLDGGAVTANQWRTKIGSVSTSEMIIIYQAIFGSATSGIAAGGANQLPNVNQTIYYEVDLTSGTGGQGRADIYVGNYTVRN